MLWHLSGPLTQKWRGLQGVAINIVDTRAHIAETPSVAHDAICSSSLGDSWRYKTNTALLESRRVKIYSICEPKSSCALVMAREWVVVPRDSYLSDTAKLYI